MENVSRRFRRFSQNIRFESAFICEICGNYLEQNKATNQKIWLVASYQLYFLQTWKKKCKNEKKSVNATSRSFSDFL